MCGIIGIVNKTKEAAPDLYTGLYALQHRGKESAGIITFDGQNFYSKRGMGEIPAVFKPKTLKKLSGKLGIAHNRYSTTSSSNSKNIQPIQEFWKGEEFWLAHSGNLVNAEEIRKECLKKGKEPVALSDSGAIATLISLSSASSFEKALRETIKKLKGAFSIIILKSDKIIAFKDELGIRPLHLGRRGGDDWLVASESCVFYHLGAVPIREIRPGEILTIRKGMGREKCSCLSVTPSKKLKEHFCIFEWIYFLRPDTVIGGRRVSEVRKNMGRLLAKECPIKADLTIPIPDSGNCGGIGFIEESGIKNGAEAIFRPHIFSRTFIEPVQEFREKGIDLKFVILEEKIKDKRIILIDDSIVRGSTARRLVDKLRKMGASEVHFRIHSPPYRYPCYYGIDTYRVKDELLAVRHNGDIEKMRKEIGADSLKYLSLESVIKAIIETPGRPLGDESKDSSSPFAKARVNKENFCTACFTGKYPIPPQK